MEEHRAGAPLGRAFFFTAQGSSARLEDPSHSIFLTWGMPGIGVDKAADIFFDTIFNCLSSGEYSDARSCAQVVSFQKFGLPSPQGTAINNAFGGINVGPVDGSYPADPPTTAEGSAFNDDHQHAVLLHFTTAPNGFEPVNKAQASGKIDTPSDQDVFEIHVKCGRNVAMQLLAPTTLKEQLFVADQSTGQLTKVREAGPPSSTSRQIVTLDTTSFCAPNTTLTLFAQILSSGGASSQFPYALLVDSAP